MSTRKELPPRFITEYTLSVDISSTGGLTDVPFEQFTRLISSNNQVNTHTSIGFDFSYVDGYSKDSSPTTFNRMVVSPCGYVILVDESYPSTDPVAITSRVITGSYDDSTLINQSHYSYDFMLCPWFTQQKILYEDSTQLLPIDASNIFQLDHGLKSPPVGYNKRLSGVWIKRNDWSSHGKRTIIRWCTQAVEYWSFVSGPVDNLGNLIFECVLYENGTIEFRYNRLEKKIDAVVGGSISFVTGSYVACGVFPGSAQHGSYNSEYLWRDFSVIRPEWIKGRWLSPLGGAPFNNGWLDSTGGHSTNYVHSMQSSLHWFGRQQFGATISFAPPTGRATLLPRNVIRKLDTMPAGSEQDDYSAYDDRHTIAFTSGVINAPTKWPRFIFDATQRTAEMQSLFLEDLSLTGAIVQAISDDFPAYCTRPSQIGAYSEDRQFTLTINTGSFYATGTNLTVTENFSSPLRDKTQIKLSFPINYKTTLLDVTGSVLYFDFNKKLFQVVAITDLQNSLPYNSSTPGTSITNWNNDSSRMFSPYGSSMASGSVKKSVFEQNGSTVYGFSDTNDTKLTPAILNDALQDMFVRDTLNCNDYLPIDDQTFKLPIDHPFVIEKIIVELPIEAGNGWFTDKTRCTTIETAGGRPANGNPGAAANNINVGGPALTFGLLHSVKPSTANNSVPFAFRNLIASGVITHANDAMSSIDITVRNNQYGSHGQVISLSGFEQFGTPSAIVGSVGTQTYTGSVTVPMTSCVSNGFVVECRADILSSMSPAAWDAFAQRIFCSKFIQGSMYDDPWSTSITYVNPLQRNNCGMAFMSDGRSIFGRQTVTPDAPKGADTFTQVPNPFFINTDYNKVPTYLTSCYASSSPAMLPGVVFAASVEKSVKSPYLVHPNDNLVIALAKSRPAISSAYKGGGSNFNYDFYAKHDIKINTGTMYVTLYGSYVRENAEVHNVSQRVNDSRCVYATAIGAEPILDQFDVESELLFYESMFESYITGSLVTKSSDTSTGASGKTVTKLLTGSRGKVFSKLDWIDNPTPFLKADGTNTLYSQYFDSSQYYAGDVTKSRHVSVTERVYDSMLPGIEDVMSADGKILYRVNDIAYVALNSIQSIPTVMSATSNFTWSYAFPYESRYSALKRYTDIAKSFQTKYVLSFPNLVRSTTKLHSGITIFTSFNSGSRSNAPDGLEWSDVIMPLTAGSTVTAMSQNDSVRTFYGYAKSFSRCRVLSTTVVGYNGMPKFGAETDVVTSRHIAVRPIIEGWKYGIFNGLPTYSSAVWRRNRFGQFRDMLEQRFDTKFFNESSTNTQVRSLGNASSVLAGPVIVRFVDQAGKTTAPENTWSSNLSFEATSSVPYFDGETRNRPDPNVKALNLGIVNFGTDLFGNIKV